MAANPDPDAPPTPSPLAYARAAGTRFGWRADGDTHVLTLPPRPWPDVLVQHGTALTAATLFMLVTAGMAVTMGRTALGGGRWAVPGRSMIGIDRVGLVVVAVGLAAIGLWVRVVMRVVAIVARAGVSATVRVSVDSLSVRDAPDMVSFDRAWLGAAVVDLRLDLAHRRDQAGPRALLQMATTDGSAALLLPWPTGPHEARLRAALGLPPRVGSEGGQQPVPE